MNINTKNCLVREKDIKETSLKNNDYCKFLASKMFDFQYSCSESFLAMSFDEGVIAVVKKMARIKKTKNLKYIFVVGIGGSNLGSQAIYEAIAPHDQKNNNAKIIFFDTVFSRNIFHLKKILNNEIRSQDEILVNLISKSGSTTETVANFEIIFQLLKKKFKKIEERIVVTTDKNSGLWEIAQRKNISILEIPKMIGGRFSVFSAVGIFPLAISGVNIDNLITGARSMAEICVNPNHKKNPAMASASILYLQSQNGINICDNFFFNPEMETVGKWYRQLMGESIGKEAMIKEKKINIGITPTVSVGSTDLHSMVQLYLGGPSDKVTFFLRVAEKDDYVVALKPFLQGLNDSICGKSFNEIMFAIYEGVKLAYKKKRKPFVELELEKIDEYNLGRYLQYKMMEIIFLAKLLGINAFDQPNVEDYKKETKKILNCKK